MICHVTEQVSKVPKRLFKLKKRNFMSQFSLLCVSTMPVPVLNF